MIQILLKKSAASLPNAAENGIASALKIDSGMMRSCRDYILNYAEKKKPFRECAIFFENLVTIFGAYKHLIPPASHKESALS